MLNCVPLPVIQTCKGTYRDAGRRGFRAGLNDQFAALIVEPLTIVVGDAAAFFNVA